jgi:hypothetical protein
MRQTRRPSSRSFWVIVARSHLTKNASSGVVHASAPFWNSAKRKSEIADGTLAQRFSPFGSNTGHCVLRSIECSR